MLSILYLTDEIAADAAARLDAEDDIPVKVEELVDTELVLPEAQVAPLLIEVDVSDYKGLYHEKFITCYLILFSITCDKLNRIRLLPFGCLLY